jgi:SOS-response transcriptional repressor LexA
MKSHGQAKTRRFYPQGEEVRLVPACPAGEPVTLPAAAVEVQAVVVALLRRFG